MSESAVYLPGLILAAMAFIAGCILGRSMEADRGRRSADEEDDIATELRSGERRYQVRRVDTEVEVPEPESYCSQNIRSRNEAA